MTHAFCLVVEVLLTLLSLTRSLDSIHLLYDVPLVMQVIIDMLLGQFES